MNVLDLHPEDIKAKIRKKGATLASIGRSAGIDRRNMTNALVLPHKAAEAAIASFLDIPAYRIWPSRYHADGRRKKPQPAENYRRTPRFTGEGACA